MNFAENPLQGPPIERCKSRQQGVALLVMLMVLVAMTFAGVALFHSMDTATLVARNMSFRQSAMLSTDAGVEFARNWLVGHGSSLTSDSATDGYYSTIYVTGTTAFDFTGNATTSDTTDDVAWKDSLGNTATGSMTPKCLDNLDDSGAQVCYVINRMCTKTGTPSSATCGALNLPSKGANTFGIARARRENRPDQPTPPPAAGYYYRITVRAAAPGNTVVFTQTFVVL